MNDRDTRRYDIFVRVRMFGIGNAGKLRSWDSTSHIEPVPQREKKPVPAQVK